MYGYVLSRTYTSDFLMRLFVIKFSIRAKKQLKKTLLKDERKFVIKKLIALLSFLTEFYLL